MISSISKKGRPQAFHRTSWGERVDGLTRLADGRWKVSGPKPVKFTEPDERLAVARCRQLQQGSAAPERGAIGVFTDHQDAADAFFRRTKPGVGSVTLTVRAKVDPASVSEGADDPGLRDQARPRS